MCCSRASLACSAFTRAWDEIRSSRLYSSLGDVPSCRRRSCTAFVKANQVRRTQRRQRSFEGGSGNVVSRAWAFIGPLVGRSDLSAGVGVGLIPRDSSGADAD